MRARDEGFLLLCSHLGFPGRPALTGPQLRVLTQRVRQAHKEDPERRLCARDLVMMGYDAQQAERIVRLMDDEALLKQYIKAGKKAGCTPIALTDEHYPELLKLRLRENSPGCLWAKGDLSLLKKPAIAVVGSRTPTDRARDFAIAAGIAAAKQGFVLVSGNAQGVDTWAQDAALCHGGSVISVVADDLGSKTKKKNVLYLSELDFDTHFSPNRALSRNRVIHCLGQKVLVSQCRLGKGGTWDGTKNNLQKGWSPVFCLDDGSEGAQELQNRGAKLITEENLKDLRTLSLDQQSIF